MRTNLKKLSLLLALLLILVGIIGCRQYNIEPDHNIEQDKDIVEQNGQDQVGEDYVDEVGASEFPLEVEDGFGNMVLIENAPERIISMAPNNTEILFALGLDDKIVGVTSFCDYPEEALEVEKIGDFSSTNFERVIELEPDLIVSYGELDPDSSEIYSAASIPVISYEPESIDEVIDTIKGIALATDSVEEGNALVKSMEEHRDQIVDKVKDTDKVRVFYEIWYDPLMAAGAGSFMDGLIDLANGINVASDAEGEYANYDVERLVENDPEIYLTAEMGESDFPVTAESISQRPGYDSITAIKNGQIYLLDGNIVSRAGPRIVEGLELIARAIHPEVFK